MQPNTSRRRSHVSPEAPIVRLDQPARLLPKHVLALSGWSHSTLYARIAAGRFPPPQKDGRMSFWHSAVVLSALALDTPTKGAGQ